MGKVKAGSVKDPLLFGLIHDYLKIYLQTQRNYSPRTIKIIVLDSFGGVSPQTNYVRMKFATGGTPV